MTLGPLLPNARRRHGLCLAVLLLCASTSLAEQRVITPLAPFEPFLGKTRKGLVDPDADIYDVSRWEPALAGKAIRIVHSVADGGYAGETFVVANAKTGDLEFYYFTTAGFMTEGTMWFDDDGALHSREIVQGKATGPSEVRARQETTADGNLRVTTRLLEGGEWRDGKTVVYKPDPTARVIVPDTVPTARPPVTRASEGPQR